MRRYIVVIEDNDALKQWKGGDKTIPLVNIVGSFDVFHSGQGSQGVLGRPSKQELDSVFGTTKDDEIVEIILTKGRVLETSAPIKYGSKNMGDSGSFQTSKGSVGGGR